MTPTRDKPTVRPGLAGLCAAAALAALAACGGSGGVDSGGTGYVPPTLAVGAISGFGSIVVAGVHYDETQAQIVDADDQPLTAAALALGTVVRIDASAITSTGTREEAVAHVVHVDEAVIGPVDSVDAAAGTAVVLGQTVVINAGTAIDKSLGGMVTGLSPGTVVAVHGLFDSATHRIVATRIEPRSGAAHYVVRGSVRTVDRTARRLTIGALTIDLADVGTLPEALASGVAVRLVLETAPAAGVWRASALRLDQLTLPDRDAVELEGRVTAFTSATQFSVAGVPVDAASATVVGTVALGARVEVEGQSVAGVLVARRVQVDGEEGSGSKSIELEGTIGQTDTAAKTFVVRGVVVAWSDTTSFESSAAADIRDGRSVSVKGRLAADRSRVDATLIHVER